ncbi:MAG: DUF167 domain-containing protein [Bifidobacteriaceae bacterium]|jgi:uncharacterized protein YggU (UPF0235/DUF167 family)|nr:DUF167 domain-containing protein [Bifidobacteriaceae bacterium]
MTTQTFEIRVKTGSSKGSLIIKNPTTDNEVTSFTIYIQQKSQNNQANKKIIELFAKYLSIPKSKINIIKGHKTKTKVLKIVN